VRKLHEKGEKVKMAVIKISDRVDYTGTIDWDRTIFDELIPLPEGTSYNSYLVRGSEKTALIDTTDPAKSHELWRNLDKAGVKKLDYIICNHAEQDHSGSAAEAVKRYGGKLVTNEKCKGFLKDFMPELKDDDFIVVTDRQELSLGDRTLQFFLTPWVHWPETMATYLKEEGILFSCDFFGSHASPSDIFESENIYISAKRYYAEIMSPFRNVIKKNLEIVRGISPKMICPSHGIVHKDPSTIIGWYEEWIKDDVKNEALVLYVSMHHSMKTAAEYLTDSLAEKGIKTKLYNLAKADIGEIAIDLIDAATVVVCAPTVLAGVHPVAANVVYIFNALRPKTKFLSLITGWNWIEKAQEEMAGMVKNFKGEIIPPLKIQGFPKKADFEAIDAMAQAVLEKHKSAGIVK